MKSIRLMIAVLATSTVIYAGQIDGNAVVGRIDD